jgi:hypothetical protein
MRRSVAATNLQIHISILVHGNKQGSKHFIVPTRNESAKEQLRNEAWRGKVKSRRNISLELELTD